MAPADGSGGVVLCLVELPPAGLIPVGFPTLDLDQLREPADLPVHRLQAVPLELEGVAVQPLTGAGQRGPQALPLPLDGAPTALEDPQPDVGLGVLEEGEADAEETAVVVG